MVTTKKSDEKNNKSKRLSKIAFRMGDWKYQKTMSLLYRYDGRDFWNGKLRWKLQKTWKSHYEMCLWYHKNMCSSWEEKEQLDIDV